MIIQETCSKQQTHREVYTEYGDMQAPGEPAPFPSEGHTICKIHVFMQMRKKESRLVVYVSGMTHPMTFAWRKTNERTEFRGAQNSSDLHHYLKSM